MPQNEDMRNSCLLHYSPAMCKCVYCSLATKNEITLKKKNSKEQWFHLFKTRGLYLQMILYSVLKTGNIVLILALLIIKQDF